VELGVLDTAGARKRLIAGLEGTGTVRNVPVDLRTKSGERLSALLSSTVLEIGGNRRLVKVLSDVSDRKRAVEALKRSEEALREANAALRETDRHKDEFL